MSSMIRIQRHMRPHNAFTVDLLKFVPSFQGLKISWTANAAKSEGAEQFVDEFLPKIQKHHPHLEYHLHRTYVDCDPFMIGLFEFNRKRKMRLSWKHSCQILAILQQWSIGGDFRPGRKRPYATIAPRGSLIWDTETKGHDVFKVFSKYKGDPPDPDALTTATHPLLHIKWMMGKQSSPLLRERSAALQKREELNQKEESLD